jgi:hypothetical protein
MEMEMDKKNNKRLDRNQDVRNKRPQNKRESFGTLGDLTPRAKIIRDMKSQKNDNKTRCACGGILKARGAVGRANGEIRWKCRKCGQTTWVRLECKPPVPIVPTSKRHGVGNTRVRHMQEHARPRVEGYSDNIT